MNSKIKLFILLNISALAFAQQRIEVKSSHDNRPIAGAEIFCNRKSLGVTNQEGLLQVNTKCHRIKVKSKGYEDQAVVADKLMQVFLEKEDVSSAKIDEIVIADKSDPRALEILKKVNQNFKDNTPLSLDSYSFKSYEKISFDLSEDSVSIYNSYLSNRLDSLAVVPQKKILKDKQKKDSANSVKLLKVFTESKMFLWERVNEFLYSKNYGEKVVVLDSRISGLQEPIYQLLTLRSNRNRIPMEILPENRNLYRFFLTDSIDIDGRENYIIRFRETNKNKNNKMKFNGYLYVDKATYAVKKIESNSNKKSDGSITSIWIPIVDKWFLSQESLKLRATNMVFKNDDGKNKEKKEDRINKEKEDKKKSNKTKFGNYVFMKVDYFDQKTPIDLNRKDFSGYTMDVKNADGSLLDQYRTDSLTQREKLTYQKIDSVGKEFKLDKKINFLSTLLRGKIRFKNIDFDVLQSRYSRYEGIRLGIGAKLNEKFNPYVSPDAYIGYGFRDKAFKYGLGLDIKTTLDRHSFFRIEYFDDVMTSGRFSQNLWNARMKIMNTAADLRNNKFYNYKGFRLSYETDITNGLTVRISGSQQRQEAMFDYKFNGEQRMFKNTTSLLTLKYSPNSKNLMTPFGKLTYEEGLPEVYFNYEQGYKALGGEFNFGRFDLLFAHQFKSKIGVTGTRLYGGIMTGSAPIWQNFQMAGLFADEQANFFSHFNLTTYLGFATMESAKYFNDKFAGYYFTHRIPWYFKSFGKNTSSFDFIYKGVIGNMKNKDIHQFQYQKLDRLYQEVGLEYNNFLSSNFNLGLFYRIGHYATPGFKENFAIQLKLKVLGF